MKQLPGTELGVMHMDLLTGDTVSVTAPVQGLWRHARNTPELVYMVGLEALARGDSEGWRQMNALTDVFTGRMTLALAEKHRKAVLN